MTRMLQVRAGPLMLVALLSLNLGFFVLAHGAFAWLAPMIQPSLGLSNMQVGMASGALAVCLALSALIAGRLADRFGKPRLILLAGTLGCSFCSVLSGLAANFQALLAARALMGAAEGAVLVVTQALIIAQVDARRRGLAIGICTSVGRNLAGIVGPPLIIATALMYGWRHAFWVPALPGLLLALLIRLKLDEGHDPTPVGRRDAVSRSIWRSRNMLVNLLLTIILFASSAAAASFLPLFLVRIAGLAPRDMSLILMTFTAAMLACGVICPALSDRFGRRTMVLVFSALSVPGDVILANAGGDVALILAGTILGSAIAAPAGLIIGIIPAESVGAKHAATAIGLNLFGGQAVGGGLMPVALGWAADRHGLVIVPWLLVALSLCMALTATMLRETLVLEPKRLR